MVNGRLFGHKDPYLSYQCRRNGNHGTRCILILPLRVRSVGPDSLGALLVVAQLAKDDRQRPCHILLASMSDIQGVVMAPLGNMA